MFSDLTIPLRMTWVKDWSQCTFWRSVLSDNATPSARTTRSEVLMHRWVLMLEVIGKCRMQFGCKLFKI